MSDVALQLAFDLACRGRDLAEAKVRELEETVAALCESKQELRTANTDLRIELQEARARLRLVDLMEQQAGARIGMRIPIRLVEGPIQ